MKENKQAYNPVNNQWLMNKKSLSSVVTYEFFYGVISFIRGYFFNYGVNGSVLDR
jgi:hypothetical protein